MAVVSALLFGPLSMPVVVMIVVVVLTIIVAFLVAKLPKYQLIWATTWEFSIVFPQTRHVNLQFLAPADATAAIYTSVMATAPILLFRTPHARPPQINPWY